MTPPDCLYAYAVLPGSATLPACGTAILPGADLALLHEAGCAMLVSRVPQAPFAPGEASRMADAVWMTERAKAHHAVMVAAAAGGPVLPLGFGLLFPAEAPLRAWLRERAGALAAALDLVAGCAEWSLRLEEDTATHEAWLDAHDPALRELGARIEESGADGCFPLGRKRAQLRAAARAAHVAALSRRLAERMQAHARALPAELTALVAAERTEALREELARIARDLAGTGLALRLAGPWPPYASARAVLDRG